MLEDKFILVRKPREYRQGDKRPVVRVSLQTYGKLSEWAAETGIPISEIANRAVEYASRHMVFVDE